METRVKHDKSRLVEKSSTPKGVEGGEISEAGIAKRG